MRKLTTKRQKLLYAMGGFGVNLMNTIMGSYLCSALLVGGFGEAAIPYQTFEQRDLIIPAIWAVFAFVAKIVDGIIDVPMAAFTDGLRSKFGRRRPAILIGLVVMMAAFAAFTLVPDPSGATMLNTIYYGVMLCIFYISYTLTMVTYYATFTEVVDTVEDRSFISNVKAFCDIVYFVIGYVLIRMMLNSINIRMVALMMLPLSLTMLIPVFMIKESSTLENDSKVKPLSLIASLKATLSNKAFVLWMITYAFMTFGVQLFLGGINEYFSYVGLSMIQVMLCSFAPVPFAFVLYNKLLRRKGFGFSFRYCMLTYSAGMLIIFFGGLMQAGTAKTIIGIVGGLICSLAVGAIFAVAYCLPSELAAMAEQKTGTANSAMYFAVQGLFSGVAAGLATGVVLTALKGSEEARSGAITYMTLICAAGTMMAFILVSILPKTIKEMGKKK